MSGQQGKQALPEIEPTAYGDALYKVLGNAARGLYKLMARVEITGRENQLEGQSEKFGLFA